MKKTRYYTQFKRSMNNYHSYFNSDEGKEIFSENNKLGYLLGMVIYYDTLNNDSINELVKKINKLDKKIIKCFIQDLVVQNTNNIFSFKIPVQVQEFFAKLNC